MGIDLYYIITPLFVGLLLLTLLTLKLTLRSDSKITVSMVEKVRKNDSLNKDQQETQPPSIFETNETLRIFSFLMVTQSFLEPCLTQRSKNKLPLFLTLSIIGLLCVLSPSLYLFCFVGGVVTIGFVLAESCFENGPAQNAQPDVNQFLQHAKQEAQQDDKKKYMYIGMSVLASGLFMGVCALTFKNYLNSVLESFIVGFFVNTAIDMLVARPVIFLIASLPLTFSRKLIVHIEEEKLRNKASNIYEKLDVLEPTISPRKKQGNSPTKIPRAIKMEKENIKDETMNTALEMVKKIKKEKKGAPGLLTPLTRRNKVTNKEPMVDQFSLNHLFDHEKSIDDSNLQTPAAHFKFDQQDESLFPNSATKTKRRGSQLMIIEFKNKEEEQKSEVNSIQDSKQGRQNEKRKMGSFIHSNFDFDNISEVKEDQKQQKEEENEQEGLKIIKIIENRDESIPIEDQISEQENIFNRKQCHQENNFMSNKNGLLCINENELEQRQIEEIDLNSPSKKRRIPMYMGNAEQEIEQIKKKKKAKHSNSNAKRRVIQFTSGQPYLEYLPKMLSKEANQHNKRSQPISFKPDIGIEERPRKSLKKIKERRQNRGTFAVNNENEYPEGMLIEDL